VATGARRLLRSGPAAGCVPRTAPPLAAGRDVTEAGPEPPEPAEASPGVPVEDELVQEELDRAERNQRRGRLRLFGGLAGAVLIGLVFALILPKIASYRDVWKVVQGLTWWQIATLVLVALANVFTFAPPWMAALPGLRFLRALRVTQASTALSLVAPGGAAVGLAAQFAMLRAWGFKGRPVGLAVMVIGVWNQLTILVLPGVALLLLTAAGGSSSRLDVIALVTLAVTTVVVTGFALALSSAELARRIGDVAARLVARVKGIVRRGTVGWSGETFSRFRAEAIGLVRHRWHVITLATLGNSLSDFLLLMVSLRLLDVSRLQVSVTEAFAAWAVARALGAIPITPGGIGVVELSLTGFLVSFGGPNDRVVAAVLVYRFLQIVPVLVSGLLAGATWRLGGAQRAVDAHPG